MAFDVLPLQTSKAASCITPGRFPKSELTRVHHDPKVPGRYLEKDEKEKW